MKLVLRGPGLFKSTPEPKTVCYSHGKRPEMPEITGFFYDFMQLVLRGPEFLNPPWTPKPCAIAHEIGQKWPESRVFYDFTKLVLWGSGPIQSTPDPKTVCYSQ